MKNRSEVVLAGKPRSGCPQNSAAVSWLPGYGAQAMQEMKREVRTSLVTADGAQWVGTRGVLTSRDGMDWQSDETLRAALDGMPGQTDAKKPVTLQNLVLDLHTGKAFFGKGSEWIWIDLLGVVWIFLGFTGLYMWWRSQTRCRDAAHNRLVTVVKHG